LARRIRSEHSDEGQHVELQCGVGRDFVQQIGLVSEVVPQDDLLSSAHALAAIFAAQSPTAIQATLRTVWAAKDLPGLQGTDLGNLFLQLGTTTQTLLEGQDTFQAGGGRVEPRIR
jgi:enoyl-CoA hydratase/carnithine racemase